jgi:hypothetical protein
VLSFWLENNDALQVWAGVSNSPHLSFLSSIYLGGGADGNPNLSYLVKIQIPTKNDTILVSKPLHGQPKMGMGQRSFSDN